MRFYFKIAKEHNFSPLILPYPLLNNNFNKTLTMTFIMYYFVQWG